MLRAIAAPSEKDRELARNTFALLSDLQKKQNGAPGEIRTPDPLVRSR